MAVEANAILLRQSTIVILARQAALREVRRQRQRQGIKGSLPMSVWSRMAIEHLDANPHLLLDAAADPIVQNLGIVRKRRTVGRKGKSLFTTQVRNGGQQ